MHSPLVNLIFIIVLTILARNAGAAAEDAFTVRGGNVEVIISPRGELTRIANITSSWVKSLRGITTLEECGQPQDIRVKRLSGGGCRFTKSFVSTDGVHRATIIESFTPEKTSIRWEVQVEGDDRPWSTGITTRVVLVDTTGARFWTTWGDPDHLSPAPRSDAREVWHEPFSPRVFRAMHLTYGGHFGNGGGYAVPVFSVLYPGEGNAASFLMSPRDPLLDIHMVTTPAGEVRQTRNFNRLEKGTRVSFTMHVFVHEPDWRAVMASVVNAYPRYFVPPSRNAGAISGLGAYSSYEGEIDAAKYRKMGGIVNWKASFDFSYMGMFIPPVPTDTTTWKRFDVNSGGELIEGRRTFTSIRQMRDYAARMKKMGFFTLNYFNVTEFGGISEFAKAVQYPPPPSGAGELDWTNPTAFLYRHFPGAILFGTFEHEGWHSLTPEQMQNPAARFHDQPFWTWGGAIATDVGDSAYGRFLLHQARLHVQKLPEAYGICIDRFDWFNEFNWHADDGKSWLGGKPVRALLHSYKEFIPRLGNIMHGAGKVIFCNPHMNRLELMEQIDGVYNEFGHIGHNRNLSAFLTFFKPLICWTPDKETVLKSPDAFMQSHLVLGAFPTAPFPGNDHTVGPDPAVERYYLEYGRMFSRLRGRVWVLIPGIVSVRGDAALCNIFKTGKNLLVPVVLGRRDTVSVHIRHCEQLFRSTALSLETWYPGDEHAATSKVNIRRNEVTLDVPLRRGCAFLVLTPG